MTTVKVLVPIGKRTDLPGIEAGDKWDLTFNVGPHGADPSKLRVFTDGPNLGMSGYFTDDAGNKIAGSEIPGEDTASWGREWNKANDNIPSSFKEKIAPNSTVHALVTVTVAGGARCDLSVGRG